MRALNHSLRLSTASLLALFPAPYAGSRDLDNELLGAINTALDGIDTAADGTKKTQDYIVLIRGIVACVRNVIAHAHGRIAACKPGARKRLLQLVDSGDLAEDLGYVIPTRSFLAQAVSTVDTELARLIAMALESDDSSKEGQEPA